MRCETPSWLAGLTLLLTAPVRAQAKPPIDNGLTVGSNEYAQVVKLEIEGRYLCSGTLVGPRTVLTAAHCLNHGDPDHPDITVSFPGGDQVSALRLFAQPRWDGREIDRLAAELDAFGDLSEMDEARRAQANETVLKFALMERYDVGLIEISPTSRNPIPIRLHGDAATLDGAPVTLVGYGSNDTTAILFSGVGTERKGTNRVFAVRGGLLYFPGEVRAHVYRWGGLWTKADGKDVGIDGGDSGGPMLADGGVVGVNVASIGGLPEFETMRRELGATREQLLKAAQDGKLEWNVSVSLSSPESAEFLKLARTKGFDVVTDQPAARRAAPPLAPKSRSLDALRRGGAFLRN